MRINLFFVFTLLFSFSVSAEDNIPAYYSTHCIECHRQIISGDPNLLYNRPGTRIDSLSALTARVDYCQKALQLHWNREQIDSVTNYLRQRFYDFK